MSKYRLLLIVPVIAVLLLAWYIVASNDGTKIKQQRELLAKAAEYAEDKVYVKALPLVKEAYAISTDIKYTDVENTLMQYYRDGGYTEEYYAVIMDRVDNGRADEDEYYQLAEYYNDSWEDDKCIALLEKAILKYNRGKLPDFYGIDGLEGEYGGGKLYSDKFIELYDKLRYSFSISTYSFEEIGLTGGGYMTVKDPETGLWAMFKTSGKKYTDFIYSEATDISQGGFASVKLGNEYLLIKYDGTRYALCKDETVTGLVRTEGENRTIVMCGDGKMHIATDFNVGKNGYDFVGAISENFRAMKDGGEWYFYSTGDDEIKEKFEDIKINAYGEAMVSGRAFVKGGNEYSMITSSGNRMENTFEDAKPFCKNGRLAAVKKNGKWGFADKNGNIVIECIYSDAQSFCEKSIGLVKGSDDMWRFIDVRGNVIDKYEFTKVREMRDNCAIAKNLDKWTIVAVN